MISIIQINVNGIRGKFKRLHELTRDYNASVLIVCELKTSNFYTYDRAELDKLLGYTLYLESARCAVYVKKHPKKASQAARRRRRQTGRRLPVSRGVLPLLRRVARRRKNNTKASSRVVLPLAEPNEQ